MRRYNIEVADVNQLRMPYTGKLPKLLFVPAIGEKLRVVKQSGKNLLTVK